LNYFFTENQNKMLLKISEELECALGVVGKPLMNMI
jgi:hypothetical protein